MIFSINYIFTVAQVRALCQDWFPIDYPLSWYIDITSSTRFYALAAVYNFTIIGLIVAEIKPYVRLNKEDKEILPDSMGKDIDVGYILSLGVHKKHRRNGIGSLLLDALLRHLTTSDRARVKAIFLHVLTTNQAAILFYESRNFRMHSFLPYYYLIRGNCKDGFTYVSYINGGHPPWTLIGNERNERRHFPHRHIFLKHICLYFHRLSERLVLETETIRLCVHMVQQSCCVRLSMASTSYGVPF